MLEIDNSERDLRFMREAIKEAYKAAAKLEVPVGAVVVEGDQVIARGHNLRERLGDPTAHAEMLALREAAFRLGSWRLNGCTLYVTMEPCPMCAGAAIQGRLDRIVFGAYDPKAGAAGSCVDLLGESCFNHQVEVTGGVLEEKCAQIVQNFFKRLRSGELPADSTVGEREAGCYPGPDGE
ncbi:MAG: tRNA adenosine(34) deaminase TadA [Thermacetogeniaceae bacterium]|nr:tRNA adenosine(34) deaminase TadA [Thermoanaerobacterales bacterium]